MLIVLTSPEKIVNEIIMIHSLFEMGLEVLHLRKPEFTMQESREFIAQIKPQDHRKIMLHQHHELYDAFQLKGIHLKEAHRNELGANAATYIDYFVSKGATVSTSYHEYIELEESTLSFNYCFLSPVFHSISKEGYLGKEINVTKSNKKVIALGGISKTNVSKALQLGYAGVGVLGAIWNSNKPIENFKQIQQQFSL